MDEIESRALRASRELPMSTTVIKNGTIVTADLTYKADVLIEGGRITHIGANLVGDTMLDATGCYVMPGGIDPHTHLAAASIINPVGLPPSTRTIRPCPGSGVFSEILSARIAAEFTTSA